MTLEDFAALIQQDLSRMATKEDLGRIATREDLAALRSEIASNHETLDNKISDLAIRISNVKDELSEKIEGLKYAKEIDELRARVNVLEAKVGIKRGRTGAAA